MGVKVANFEDLGDYLAGPVSIVSSTSSSSTTSQNTGMVPYFIASGDTFTVPLYKQAPFAITIDNEGILDIEGYLIEVD